MTQRMMTAISRTMRDMVGNARYLPAILEDHCKTVQCSFEKTCDLFVEMYPIFYFTFNANDFHYKAVRKKSGKKSTQAGK